MKISFTDYYYFRFYLLFQWFFLNTENIIENFDKFKILNIFNFQFIKEINVIFLFFFPKK